MTIAAIPGMARIANMYHINIRCQVWTSNIYQRTWLVRCILSLTEDNEDPSRAKIDMRISRDDNLSHAENGDIVKRSSISSKSDSMVAVCENANNEDDRSSVFSKTADFYKRSLPRLPFCEEYDGVNLRKTRTISQSIQELMESQRKAREEAARSNLQSVTCRSTQYFDSVQEDDEIAEQARDLVNTVEGELAASESDDSVFTGEESASDHLNVDTFMDMQDGLCTVDLELEYIATTSRLIVNVVRAEDVKNKKDPTKLMNTFVKVSMYHGKNSKKQKTGIVEKSLNPVFNHKVYLDDVIEKWMHIMCLRVQLYEKTMLRKNCIGEALIWVDDLELTPNTEVKLTKSLHEPFL